MKTAAIMILLFLLLSGVPAVCPADTAAIGVVKTVKNSAFIARGGETLPAEVGMRVEEMDVLKTGPDGSMGVIFKDDTVVSLGPDSELQLEQFLFEPAKGKLSFVARMIQGTISFISGQIAKLSPDSVRLEIPAATIGVRGTQVLIQAERPQ